MTVGIELQALSNILRTDIIGRNYYKRLFDTLARIEPVFAKILRMNMERYAQVKTINTILSQPTQFQDKLESVINACPTFLFLVGSQLSSNPNYLYLARQLNVASIVYFCCKNADNTPFVDLFIRSMPAGESLDSLNNRVFERSKDSSYLPKVVYWDLFLIAKKFLKLPPTRDWREMVENHFFMQGLSHFFIKYYFDLMCRVDTDEAATNVHNIFSNYLVCQRIHEINYWKAFSDAPSMINRLEKVIEFDSSINRHPDIRKHVFRVMLDYNPILHDGKARKMSLFTQERLKSQSTALYNLSFVRLGSFFKVVLDCMSSSYIMYLLTQMAKMDPNKVIQFHDYLENDIANSQAADISRVIRPFIKKLQPQKEVFYEDTTAKRRAAAERMTTRSHERFLSPDEVSGYIRDYYKKLYDKVKKDGALTQEQITAYLKKVSQAAAAVLSQTKLEAHTKEVFEESIEDTLKDIYSEGNLSNFEMDDYRSGITTEMNNIETEDFKERAEKVDSIGNVIVEAKTMSHRKKEATDYERGYSNALQIGLTIEDGGKEHEFTVEDVLNLPVVYADKQSFLYGYSPEPIAPSQLKLIEDMQKRVGRSSSNPEYIYQNKKLMKKKLLKLLFPPQDLDKLLARKAVPILFDKDGISITVRDFFTFPLGPRKGPKEDEWFLQHMKYLLMCEQRSRLQGGLLDELEEVLEDLPKIQYKKYYHCFPSDNIEEAVFMAVFSLYQNNALLNLRISE